MSMDQFDELTRANMEVALERVCLAACSAKAAQHSFRAVVAESIFEAAQQGHRTLSKLTEAGRLAVKRLDEMDRSIRLSEKAPPDAIENTAWIDAEGQAAFEPRSNGA